MSVFANVTMRSVILDMDVKIQLSLPENRHQTDDLQGRKYPILYILHGYKEDCSTWMNFSTLPLLTRDLDLIVCTVSESNGFYINQSCGFRTFDFLTKELPVKLKNFLPISDRREDTYVMGESMGGYGTLRLALGAPEVYGHACVLSGCPMDYDRLTSLDSDHRMHAYLGSKSEYEQSDNNIYNLIDKLNQSGGSRPEIQLYCGTEDPLYPDCRKFSEYMLSNGKDWKFTSSFSHGKHDFYFWNSVLPQALKGFGFDIDIVDAAI